MAENFYGNTDVGRMRSNNEDAFVAEEIYGGKMILAGVIDGVGGYDGGEVAAAITRQTLLDVFQRKASDITEAIRLALLSANDAIYHETEKSGENERMACVATVAVVDVQNNKFYYGHIGDTRLYLLRGESLVKITRDHSFVGFLEDQRKISEDEAMRHPKRNEINKALGFDRHMRQQEDYIETGTSAFLPGDLLMLCSDGLTDLVNSKTIVATLTRAGSLKDKTQQLIDVANEAGGKDNITVVLVANSRKPLAIKAAKSRKKKPQQTAEPVKNEPATIVSATRKKKTSWVPVLVFLLLVSLAAVGWLLWNRNLENEPEKTVVLQTEQELQLSGNINNATDTYVPLNTAEGSLIVLTDTVKIIKDSLHLNGNGTVIKADSAFGGPAFYAPDINFLLLENITFENFDVAIFAPARAMQFRNVRFINCRVPLLAKYRFPGTATANGRLTDSLFSVDIIQIPDSITKPRRP